MPLICSNCRYENRDSARFCQKCGKNLVLPLANRFLETGVILDRRYEIKKTVRAGVTGGVYEAIDSRFTKKCIVKEMGVVHATQEEREYLIKRFEREAELLFELRHVNLPDVFDYFAKDKCYYLVMEYIDGMDFGAIMKCYNNNIVPEILVIDWSLQILEVLNFLHSLNPPVIYRGLKPGHIMLDRRDGRIKLVDFSIARLVTEVSKNKRTGLDAPGFASEELYSGTPEPRTDLYSLGAVMHCLLTGIFPELPFSFKPVREHNPKVRQELEEIIMKALEMKAKDRYSSAKEMADILKEVSSGNGDIKKEMLKTIFPDKDSRKEILQAESPADTIFSLQDRVTSLPQMSRDDNVPPLNYKIADVYFSARSVAGLVYFRKCYGNITFPLDKECNGIGRSRENDLILDYDKEVSGRHARVIRENNDYFIEDLGSMNGTFVNGEKINHKVKLHNNDSIRTGRVEFLFKSTQE